MKKRVLSFIIALSLAFAIPFPAFAESGVCPYCGGAVFSREITIGALVNKYFRCESCGKWCTYNGTSITEISAGYSAFLDNSLDKVTVGGGSGRSALVSKNGRLVLYGRHDLSVGCCSWGTNNKKFGCIHSGATNYSDGFSNSGRSYSWEYLGNGSSEYEYFFCPAMVFDIPVSGIYYPVGGKNAVANMLSSSEDSSCPVNFVDYRNVYFNSGYFYFGSSYSTANSFSAGQKVVMGPCYSTSEMIALLRFSITVDLSDFYLEYEPLGFSIARQQNSFTYIDQSVTVNEGDIVYNYNNNYYYYDSTDNSTTIYYVDVESAVQSGAIVHIDADGSITITPAGAAAEPDPTPTPEATATPTPTPTATPDGGGTGTTDPTPTPTPGGTGGGDSSSGGNWFADLLSTLLGGIVDVLKGLFDAVTKVIFGLFGWITKFLAYVFDTYLGGVIPTPVVVILCVAVPLVFVLAIIRFLKGFF